MLGRTRAENATYVIAQVRALGLNPHPASRLMEMHRVLSRGHIPYGDPDFPTALEAELDMQMLGFVFDQTQAYSADTKFRTLIKHLLNDSIFPQHDIENSPGRDAQFELYMAAVCQKARLLPVSYEEPDVTCTIEGTKFAIAAKRIKSTSRSKIEKHIRKAADQIKKTNLPGIIALDLSLARNQHNRPIVSDLESQMYVFTARARNFQFFDDYHQDIYRWVAGSGVRGVVVFEFTKRRRTDREWGRDRMTCWLQTTHDDERASREYEAIHHGFLAGMPNLEDLADAGEDSVTPPAGG